MLKHLDEAGLVEHTPYHGVRLTQAGEQLALTVIRRHRLLQLFLSTALNVPHEDLHRYADLLEHAVTDEPTEIIAHKLGNPPLDPYLIETRFPAGSSTSTNR